MDDVLTDDIINALTKMVETITELRDSIRLELEEKNQQIKLLQERLVRLDIAVKKAENDKLNLESEIRQLAPRRSIFSFMRIG